jgi:hypothetical protein
MNVIPPSIVGQGVNWCFRISVSKPEEFDKIKTITAKKVRSISCQLEESAKGQLHIQGVIHLNGRCRFSALKDQFVRLGFDFGGIWVSRLTSSEDVRKMELYVEKKDTRFDDDYQHRIYPEKEEKVKPHEQVLRLLREHGETEALGYFVKLGYKAKVWSEAKDSYNLEQQNYQSMALRRNFEKDVWKPWQLDLYTIINEKPHNRIVYSIVDPVGNSGKTYFVKRAVAELTDKVVSVTNGKSADLSMIVSRCKSADTILMSLSRSVEMQVNYQSIEQFKDGVFCSTKYESTSHVGNCRHFVIFSNFSLRLKQLSLDRWIVWRLDEMGGYKSYTAEEYLLAFPDECKDDVVPLTEMSESEPSAKRQKMFEYNAVLTKSSNCPKECYDKCCTWRMNCKEWGRGYSCKPNAVMTKCVCDNKK